MGQTIASEELEFLKKSLIFEDLDDATVSALLEGSLLQRFPVGTVLFNQGEIPDFLYLVLEGALELFTVGPDGDDTIIEILEAPDTYTVARGLTMATYLVSGRVAWVGKLLMLRGGAALPHRREPAALPQHAGTAVPAIPRDGESGQKLETQDHCGAP